MSRTAGPFLGPREELTALTLVGPRTILGKLFTLSKRVGISRHVLAALAIDEYMARHYPEKQEGEQMTEQSTEARDEHTPTTRPTK